MVVSSFVDRNARGEKKYEKKKVSRYPYSLRLATPSSLRFALPPRRSSEKRSPRLVVWHFVLRPRLSRSSRSCENLANSATSREEHRLRISIRRGKLDRLPDLADELVRLKVDVIVAPNTPAAVPPRTLRTRSRLLSWALPIRWRACC